MVVIIAPRRISRDLNFLAGGEQSIIVYPMQSKLEREIAKSQHSYQHARTPKRKYSQARSNAKQKNIQFLLTMEEYLELYKKPCFYCGKASGDTGCGLDRVDNTIGYMITNVVPCCSHCNQMKINLPLDIFLQRIRQVYKNLLARGLIT